VRSPCWQHPLAWVGGRVGGRICVRACECGG
jgi:hypothetical protein